MAFCGSGERPGVPIDYSIESEPLGKAGPLGLISDVDNTFLAMNGDLLTDLDFRAMVKFHQQHEASATIGLYRQDVKVDLGVIETDCTGLVQRYIEKPVYHHTVSMGVYLFEPHVLAFVPKGQRFDLPDLIRKLIEANHRVVRYGHSGLWLDIGRPEDHQRAQEDFSNIRSRILDVAS